MSTNRKKLYIPSDIKIAQEESKKKGKYFTSKTSKRKTHQIRIGEEFYKKVKELAKNEDMMLSFMLDEICKFFFKNINNKRFLSKSTLKYNYEQPIKKESSSIC